MGFPAADDFSTPRNPIGGTLLSDGVNSWVAVVGDAKAIGGACQAVASPALLKVNNLPTDDQWASVEGDNSGNTDRGSVARLTDANNYYAHLAGTSPNRLYKRVAGVLTQLGSDGSGSRGDQKIVHCVGNVISGYIYNILTLDIGPVIDSAHTGGAVGIYIGISTQEVGDFAADSLGAPVAGHGRLLDGLLEGGQLVGGRLVR